MRWRILLLASICLVLTLAEGAKRKGSKNRFQKRDGNEDSSSAEQGSSSSEESGTTKKALVSPTRTRSGSQIVSLPGRQHEEGSQKRRKSKKPKRKQNEGLKESEAFKKDGDNFQEKKSEAFKKEADKFQEKESSKQKINLRFSDKLHSQTNDEAIAQAEVPSATSQQKPKEHQRPFAFPAPSKMAAGKEKGFPILVQDKRAPLKDSVTFSIPIVNQQMAKTIQAQTIQKLRQTTSQQKRQEHQRPFVFTSEELTAMPTVADAGSVLSIDEEKETPVLVEDSRTSLKNKIKLNQRPTNTRGHLAPPGSVRYPGMKSPLIGKLFPSSSRKQSDATLEWHPWNPLGTVVHELPSVHKKPLNSNKETNEQETTSQKGNKNPLEIVVHKLPSVHKQPLFTILANNRKTAERGTPSVLKAGETRGPSQSIRDVIGTLEADRKLEGEQSDDSISPNDSVERFNAWLKQAHPERDAERGIYHRTQRFPFQPDHVRNLNDEEQNPEESPLSEDPFKVLEFLLQQLNRERGPEASQDKQTNFDSILNTADAGSISNPFHQLQSILNPLHDFGSIPKIQEDLGSFPIQFPVVQPPQSTVSANKVEKNTTNPSFSHWAYAGISKEDTKAENDFKKQPEQVPREYSGFGEPTGRPYPEGDREYAFTANEQSQHSPQTGFTKTDHFKKDGIRNAPWSGAPNQQPGSVLPIEKEHRHTHWAYRGIEKDQTE